VGSTFTHASVAVAMLMGGGASASGGEGGLRGGGDTSIDISVAGAEEAHEVAPPAPAETTPPPPVTPPPKAPPVQNAPPPPPPAPPDPDSDLTPPPPDPTTPPPSLPPVAVGGDATNGGRAPGPVLLGGGPANAPKGDTVEGQRALLPSAVTCKDPVVGRWESLKFNPTSSTWVRFALLVHRADGGALTGTILSHTWFGNAFDRTPPPCTPRGFEMSVSMNARGRADLVTHIRFGASRYSVVAVQCPMSLSDYAPDNFSGMIDTDRQEFQSVNNDGATDIDAPYVFRRTACLDE